jgi:hypothetical protein
MAEVDLATLSPSNFQDHEDDTFEFKSSKMGSDEFKKELDHAASAFANSGGGCLIWGVNDKTGDPDGGVEKNVGRQSVNDWIDAIIHSVSPQPKYDVKLYEDAESRGTLDSDKCVVAISFPPSANVPHMANDKHYWIRAGAHTRKAGHFLVEALWAKRQITAPVISHALRLTRLNPTISARQLGVVCLTDNPAIDVQINLSKIPRDSQLLKSHFPMKVPSVDRQTPAFFTLQTVPSVHVDLRGIYLTASYKDFAGNEYKYEPKADLAQANLIWRE